MKRHDPLDILDDFRTRVYGCMTRRPDALFELADAIACTPSRVTDVARLSLEPEQERGHGGVYDALNAGHVDYDRFGRVLAATPVPTVTGPDGRARIVLAVDVSNWLRPDAATSPDRSFCHTYARGRGRADMIPGWPYSFVVAVEPGPTSWTAVLSFRRLRPGDDATGVTAGQLRTVVENLRAAGHHQAGDPDILVVADAGYDLPRLAWLLAGLPVEVLGRVRSNRVYHRPADTPAGPARRGRPPRHGTRLSLRDASTHDDPAMATTNDTDRYGHAAARAWTRTHPRLERRGPWAGHEGPTPVIEGTLISLRVERLPGDRTPRPLWLWVSTPEPADPAAVDHWWSMFCRRFDIEHTFRFLKQQLGWTRARLREPAAADRWTALIVTAHTQLRLARTMARDCRLPWQRPLPAEKLTPTRVRAGFRRIHQTLTHPAKPPKTSTPGPGRPHGHPNRHKAPIQPIGKAA
ncbi:NF041680 family putative transposase [Aeromicrobium sp.]|uniref:NF041680 family putative transposase n=1 Tax=Aeromicrobium sp. TaxID=1871063 RepID=UPI0039E37829